jgi:U3 small nucleolar ribonucleoprotein protein IMP3
MITKLSHKIKQLPPTDNFRIKITEQLLNKLYNIGLINSKDDLGKTLKMTVSAFCRRRLPVIM